MKKVFVLCGVPGSGKSTLVKKLREKEGVLSCSADNFFMQSGEYKFDPSKLGQAHADCLRDFIYSVQHGISTIVVDNTNTTVAEISPYVAIGSAYGYDVSIVHVDADPVEAHKRNIHGVPLASVQRMSERLNDTLLQIRKTLPWWKIISSNDVV